jgi:hypothetical protein
MEDEKDVVETILRNQIVVLCVELAKMSDCKDCHCFKGGCPNAGMKDQKKRMHECALLWHAKSLYIIQQIRPDFIEKLESFEPKEIRWE